MSDTIIHVADLVKEYGAVTALRGLSFQMKKGEFLGILGPNGAGKTTTVSILSCQRKLTSGEVKIAGLDIERNRNEIKGKIGLVPQDIALYPTLTAEENLDFFGGIQGMSGKKRKQRIDEVLEIVSLSDRKKSQVHTFSGGMKRRVNLAAALMHEPEILILDEPTVGVDPQSRNQILEKIQYLNRHEGMSVLYTTHYMEEAQRLCDRVGIVDHGAIIEFDTPDRLVEKHGVGFLTFSIHGENEGALARFSELPDVISLHGEGVEVKVETADVESTLSGVMEVIQKNSLSIHELKVREPNLESVFLKLTGSDLRDGSPVESQGLEVVRN